MRNPLVFFLLVFIVGQPVLGSKGTMDDWIRLTDTLFANYTNEVRPAYNFNETVVVNSWMFLLSILDFDEVAGVITLSAGMGITWTDYRLKWNPADYNGLEDILINSSRVWKPKLYMITSADDLEQFGHAEFDVRLDYNGTCSVFPGKLLKSSCSVDMTRFPVDSQLCEMLVLLWGLNPTEVELTSAAQEISLEYFTPNGEWKIDKTSVYKYMGFGSPSQTTAFTIHMTRRSMYFIISMTIPVFLLCFLNPFVFLLPSSSGERISYTITMFLSLAVYMTLIGDNLPKVSENMAGMSYFLLMALIYSSLLILLTIFTLRCEALSDVSKFPRWLRRLTRCFKRRGNKISYNKSENVQDVNENEEKEGRKENPDDSLSVSKSDVMTLIDVSLFVVSFLMIVIASIWFLVRYYV
ncbi:acetylcholine receptor subunit alpha-like [Mizuhopecten yessoensis]|uniref:Acetylcholine receptor subunit alpha n=1 Tax=Mizuhopecten yessoensis TaxID=6573 RepID=A0A210QY96_MIZYE|nr:acetylcholine receptor subunit alpha-like [Mizuhopecten yessoensis]OWF53672.1 Acetylcholine receptor subunit alpha [Mizuhopecten yessoensis]